MSPRRTSTASAAWAIEVGLTKSPAESAKIIIAEVNQKMPRTLGDSFIHVSRLNYIVPVDYDLPEMADGAKVGRTRPSTASPAISPS